jgi:hypothetical protein
MVSLLYLVQKERRFEIYTNIQLQWFIPIPGLFY